MADNRQFADHGVIGGVDVFYEDKKLAESPSQSSVASTDYFVLKDTDGVPHKIVKSDVLEMVRDAMGTILANNNKGTSVAKVPTIGSSGNDLGSSSVADLASVLGVAHSGYVTSIFENNGYYYWIGQFNNSTTDKPSGEGTGSTGVFVRFRINNANMYFAIAETETHKVFVKCTWFDTNWVAIV